MIRGTSPADGTPTGTYKIVNRYSGLVIGLSSDMGRPAETTPTRTWTNATGNAVGGTRTAAEQTLTLTATGPAPGTLDGTHTLTTAGRALDNPGHSTTPGTQLITWTPNGGANQNWTFIRQTDGTYVLRNGASGLCADVENGSTGAGAKIIQWTCTSAANQRWNIVRRSDGTYTVASAASGLLLTTASSADGSPVTQQPDTGSGLQRWTLG